MFHWHLSLSCNFAYPICPLSSAKCLLEYFQLVCGRQVQAITFCAVSATSVSEHFSISYFDLSETAKSRMQTSFVEGIKPELSLNLHYFVFKFMCEQFRDVHSVHTKQQMNVEGTSMLPVLFCGLFHLAYTSLYIKMLHYVRGGYMPDFLLM